MLGAGVPETVDEATHILAEAAKIVPGSSPQRFWPHGQVIALSQLVLKLTARVEQLEARLEGDRPRRGRPPKAATAATQDLVDTVAAHL